MARLHKRAPQPFAAPLGNDVEQLQVAVPRLLPQRGAESEHRHAVRTGRWEKDGDVTGGEQLVHALGNGMRTAVGYRTQC